MPLAISLSNKENNAEKISMIERIYYILSANSSAQQHTTYI